jgi:hypothetical protein
VRQADGDVLLAASARSARARRSYDRIRGVCPAGLRLAGGGVARGVGGREQGVVWSGGRLEGLLDSGGEELWLPGLDQVCRAGNFVVPAGQAGGVAALVLAAGGVLALPPFGGAGHGAAAVPADAPGQRLPVNGQMAGRCSDGGVSRRGWLRSRKSVSALAAASRRVSAGRFHFSSMVARIEVWS